MNVFITEQFYNLKEQLFNECEFCGLQYKEEDEYLKVSTYYHMHDMILCDRCVDKLNSYMNDRSPDEYWLPVDAERNGFPPFPYAKLYEVASHDR